MADTTSTAVPTLEEVEALRDIRDAAWAKLGDAQRIITEAQRSLNEATADYRQADDTYCAARKASGTTQQPR